MLLLWTNDSLIKRATRYRVGPSLRLAVPPSPKVEARVRAVAVVVPPLSVMLLLSNLIKGTLVHIRAKVMNERGAAALGEYGLTVGRWFLS
jgi:hypothetical protein